MFWVHHNVGSQLKAIFNWKAFRVPSLHWVIKKNSELFKVLVHVFLVVFEVIASLENFSTVGAFEYFSDVVVSDKVPGKKINYDVPQNLC